MEEIHEFCFKEFAAVCLFWNFLFSGIPVILLITQVIIILVDVPEAFAIVESLRFSFRDAIFKRILQKLILSYAAATKA